MGYLLYNERYVAPCGTNYHQIRGVVLKGPLGLRGCIHHTWGCSSDLLTGELVRLPVLDGSKVRAGSAFGPDYSASCPATRALGPKRSNGTWGDGGRMALGGVPGMASTESQHRPLRFGSPACSPPLTALQALGETGPRGHGTLKGWVTSCWLDVLLLPTLHCPCLLPCSVPRSLTCVDCIKGLLCPLPSG